MTVSNYETETITEENKEEEEESDESEEENKDDEDSEMVYVRDSASESLLENER
jgi:hypothetical protein